MYVCMYVCMYVDSETSSSSGESLDEFHRKILQGGEILGYQFEPRRDSNNSSGESADIERRPKYVF